MTEEGKLHVSLWVPATLKLRAQDAAKLRGISAAKWWMEAAEEKARSEPAQQPQDGGTGTSGT